VGGAAMDRTRGTGMLGGLLAGLLAVALLGACASDAKREEQQSQVDYHYRLGMAYLEDNNLQGAMVEFRNAAIENPESAKVQFALGHTDFKLGDYAAAQAAMERVLKIDPQNGEAINYLGNIYEQQGRLDDAIAAFQKAIAVPTYSTPNFAYRNLARVYLAQGKTAEAEAALGQAIRRVPEYYPARADLAKLYMDEKRWSQAVETWRALLDLIPDLEDAHYYLAESYVGQGDSENAKRELTTFLGAVSAEHPLAGAARDLLKKLGGTP
jgi:type IV pilus assembly protein PilF